MRLAELFCVVLFLVIFIGHISGPRRAIGPVCVFVHVPE